MGSHNLFPPALSCWAPRLGEQWPLRSRPRVSCRLDRPAQGVREDLGHRCNAQQCCIATHPSDMCVVLAALDAIVHAEGPGGARAIVFTDFHRLPGDTPHIETELQRDELITSRKVGGRLSGSARSAKSCEPEGPPLLGRACSILQLQDAERVAMRIDDPRGSCKPDVCDSVFGF